MFKKTVLLAFIALFIACESDSTKDQSSSDRPLDTWLFRSVLDQKPRMLVAALHPDLYVAYETTQGKLYKAWKGIVNLQGAVYDGAHGSQPMSVGDAYIWNKTEASPWTLKKAGQEVEFEFDYKGHRIEDGTAELIYQFDHDGKAVAELTEKIDYTESETGQLGLERVFTVEKMDDAYSLQWKTEAVLVDKSQAACEGAELQSTEDRKIEFDNKSFILYELLLEMDKNGEISLNVPMLETVFLDPNIEDGFDAGDSSLPRGAQLIGKNDCKTCHNVSKKTVGPSYKSIAKKYEHTDENKLMLANKIAKGGSGVWGEQVMTAHPEIPEYDLEEMVSYIFSLADFEGESSKDAQEGQNQLMPVEISEENLIPGALTRIYNIKKGTASIPGDLSERKPIQAGILPNFDNISGGDFRELEDNFALRSVGVIKIDTPGVYGFRLWSDDGSRLFLNRSKLIDNDGLHGTEMKQADLELEKGYYAFVLEFFQGAGGKFLSFNMRAPWDDAWKVVPQEIIMHKKEDQKYLTELSLPMSVVTKIPGDGMSLTDVHPSFDLKQARPSDFKKKIGGLDFLADGRMVVSVWDEEGGVYIINNHQSPNPEEITYKRIAQGLAEPLGLKVVDDRIFVMQKQEMTELIDLDGDEVIDEYRTLCDDWGVTANFHEFGFGLEEKEGYLYANLATGILPGGAGMPNQHPDRGSCIKVSIADGRIEFIANGLRTPNGVGLGYKDEIFVADNQGDWLPASKIVHVQKGDWFGSRAVDFEGTASYEEKKPVVWLPQDEIGNSPSTPLYLNQGPYRDQMIHGEVTHGGIKRVFVEEVHGALQGCVFRFIQGLEAGVNRLRWSPEGVLYAGGIGNPGNWQHTGKLWYGLQSLKYNGNSAFEMLAVRAKSNGLEIEFTEPLKLGDGWLKEDYEVRSWYYEPTANYGGPKLDDKRMEISSVSVSEDRKRVFLELEAMEDDRVYYLRLKNHFISDMEHSLWSTEAWYTMNAIPSNALGFKRKAQVVNRINVLNSAEKQEGWELLFDGKKIDRFHNFNKTTVDSKWYVDDGAIHFDPEAKGEGGDLISNEQYENFELKLEWKISNCGNSGIFFNVVEDEKYCCPYLTGPEMQVLDNTCHPDSRFVTHRAGDLYDMIETSMVTVKPAGEWNRVRIVSNNGEVEFWLNGYKVVEFTMHNEEWKQMIANSKFSQWEDFGLARSGHIGIQDHSDKVWFRNIKIRRL